MTTYHHFRFLLIGLLMSLSAQAQDIVINEYYNTASQNDEWTELVVVKDNLDLTGRYLGDNNAGTSSWQPKLQFANHPLWKNLRAGTIIKIDHAANVAGCNDTYDTDKSDGFIRVCCRNATFFEGGATTTLFLADEGDFVQIVDPSGKMIHGIGHDDDPGSSVVGGTCFTTSANWTNTNSARSATRPCGNYTYYNFQMTAPSSLIMKAGTNGDFSSGMQTNANNPFIEVVNDPFDGIGNGGANNTWVQELRAPIIEAQTICLVKAPNSGNNVLLWEAATDPYPADNSIGYMILRNTNDNFPLPQQGKQYFPGNIIGSGNQTAQVVGINTGSASTFYAENPGPGTFYYRVFAFRYVNTSNFEHSTRGRTYNLTNFIKVNSEPAPVLVVGNDTLCGPGLAKLWVERPNLPNPGSTQWFSSATGGNPILVNSDTLNIAVSQSTSYWVMIQSAAICSEVRTEVKALIVPLPCEYVAPDSACVGVPVVAMGNAIPGISYVWTMSNPPAGVKTSRSDSNAYVISVPNFGSQRWIYFSVRARNDEGCQSPIRRDSLYTTPWDYGVTATPSNPVEGDTVTFRILSNRSTPMVLNWNLAGGTEVSPGFIQLKALAAGDSVKVSPDIVTEGPTDAQECRASLLLSVPVTAKPNPLKPINNLITLNGDDQNATLNFDRRTVKNLEIFDRWGKKIATYGTYANEWKPEGSETALYFYTAEMEETSGSGFKKINGWVWAVQ